MIKKECRFWRLTVMLEKIRSRISSFGTVRFVIALLLLISIIVTLAFVFSNSLKSPSESAYQSSSFKKTVEKIIPPDTELGSLILDNIRKVAHFTEYGLLGIETALLIFVISHGRKARFKKAGSALIFVLVIAFLDETLQIFSKRGPTVSDMWIDVGGFFTYMLLSYLGFEFLLLTKFVARTVKERFFAKAS